jgi:hypothetical protein
MEGFFVLGVVLLSVCIPVCALVLGANAKERHKLRAKELELLGGKMAQDVADQAARMEWMEERMRVVERIVTDKGLALSDEIERLREPEPVRALRDQRAD